MSHPTPTSVAQGGRVKQEDDPAAGSLLSQFGDGMSSFQNMSSYSPSQPFRPNGNSNSASPMPFTSRDVSATPTLSVKPSDVSGQTLPSGASVPPPVVAGMGTLPMNLAPTQQATAEAGPSSMPDITRVIPTNKNNPAFLNKLRSMVDDQNTNELICWSPDGASFFVPNHTRFGDEVLPRFFKHSNFSSFVRQLNMYGFHKVPHLQQGALKHDQPQESELWEFSNPNFHRDHPEWLSKVQRKKGTKDDTKQQQQREESAAATTTGQELMQAGALMRTDFGAGADGSEGALQLASVLNALNNIKNAQSNIITDLHHLQNSHQNLWQAELESRQRQKRTSDTVNKILRFLAGVFGNQEEDDPTPVAGKKGAGKGAARGGAAGRRVGVRPQQRKGRLMIEDGKSDAHANVIRGLEDLELPTDTNLDEIAQDMPSYLRFQEATSNPESPKNSSNGSRFTTIGSPPNISADFANLASEAPTTPGGSRRLSSHASNQVLNALASGEGNAWLASLFGASLAKQGSSKGTSPASSGGGLKLDPQVVSALQQALAGGSESDYLNAGSAPGGADKDFASRFSYPNSYDNNSSNRSASTSAQGLGHGLGLDADALARLAGISQALVQSPARPTNNSSYFSGTPTKPQPANTSRDDANSQQLALSLARSTRDLQNTTSEVTSVQNSINALIEGLSAHTQQQPTPATTSNQPAEWPTQSNDPTLSPASNAPTAPAATMNTGVDTDFDVDSFLSQFVDTSQAPGGGVTSPGTNTAFPEVGVVEGESPSFAFSPTTTSSFLRNAGVPEEEDVFAPTIHSIDSSTVNTPTPSSPSSTPIPDKTQQWNMTLPKSSKKRKPSSSSLDPLTSVQTTPEVEMSASSSSSPRLPPPQKKAHRP